MSFRAAITGLAVTAGLLAMPALGPVATAGAASTHTAGPHAASTHAASTQAGGLKPACPAPKRDDARCFVLYRPQYTVNRAIDEGHTGKVTHPEGIGAKGLEAAYRLPVSRQSHQTVAVSIAYRTPHLAQYLAHYRAFYGLPPCTIGSGCLRIVNQHGKASPLPQSGAGSGWDLEATLDVSMISAACPHCKIIVAEATDPSFKSMAESENAAARLGAQVISNSYGAREDGLALKFSRSYDHPGHTIVVSAGDYGYTAANFPADLASVTAVGGTELARAHNQRGWTERTWNNYAGAGSSGCSAYVPKPAWQKTVRNYACPGRTVADVSAVAWNVPIWNKYWGGWITVGGTSVSAPLIAGVYGLAGNAASISPGYPYARRSALYDIRTGNNAWFSPPGPACGRSYLCVAKKGYDAPTGLGTPDGTGAF
ncbi:MAG: S8 family serine peptidase [Streptosporangiaceae bacterium]